MRIKYIILLSCVLLLYNVNAQDFEVSPVKLYFSAEPGESQTINLNIKNHGNKPETFILNIGDFLIDSKGQKELLEANSTKSSCTNWLSINPSFVEINPNEEKEIGVTMMVPNGEFGTRWAIIYVRQVNERTTFAVDEGISAGVGMSPRIAVNVIQSPKSNMNVRAQINRLKEISNPGDSIRTFSVNVENIGDKMAQCKVFLIASSLTTAEEFPVDTVFLDTYPNSKRTVNLELPDYLPKGSYSLSAILDYGSSKTLEGTQMMIEVE